MTLWLFHIALFAQYGGVDGSFDPENPANPEPLGVRYGLHVVAQPEGAGTTNLEYSNEIAAGSRQHLYAYPKTGYDFKEWRCDGELLSTEQDFYFTMPEKDVTVTAVFTFNPQNPGNPGANDWDLEKRTLIVDDFTTGNLSDAIYQATDGHPGQVQTLIVSGRIDNNDLGGLAAFTSMEVIDLSRCYGATTVPSWYFNGNDKLKEFTLPASITTIEDCAFYGCTNLTSLYSYAPVPPTLGVSALQNTLSDLVVYVPADYVALYAAADGWKNLNIQPIGAILSSLEVRLPEDGDEGRYKNNFIELVNKDNGQVFRYVITDALQYTFKYLPIDTKWTAYMKDAQGEILGSIEGIKIADKNLSVQFGPVITPVTISAEVRTPQGGDVSEQVSYTWFNSNGSYLGQGSSIDVLPLEGATVTLRITLSDELALSYERPQDYVYSVQAEENNIVLTLTDLPKVMLTGVVLDAESKSGISGAAVTVSQILSGGYTKSFTATTDSNGAYIISNAYLRATSTSVTAYAENYTNATVAIGELAAENGVATLETLYLRNLQKETNTTISVSFKYIYSTEAGLVPRTEDYTDLQNVMYTIWNLSKGIAQIKEFNVNGQEIILLEDVDILDQLLIMAMSKTNAFAPITVATVVNEGYKATAQFEITQLGQIKASYLTSDAPNPIGILYDANEKFVRSGAYESGSLLFTDLTAGAYTLVSMNQSKLFNTIYDLNKFSEAGLVKGTHYVTSSVYVMNGLISTVKTAYVPYFDESDLDFMGSQTSFSVNKTMVTAGNNLTLSTLIDFKKDYVADISDVNLIVDLDSCNLVAGSVMVGGKVSEYTYSGTQVIIPVPVANLADRIRFCINSSKDGEFTPSASVQFLFRGKQMTKPIGQVSFTVEKHSISVPATVNTPQIPVSGSAPARAEVRIYDGNTQIGLAMALSNGTWSTTCELYQPANPSIHHIYARIRVDGKDEEMLTETQTLKYEEDKAVLQKITMLNTAHPANSLRLKQYTTIFDFTKSQRRTGPYWYWPDYPEFTFLVEFNKVLDGEPELFVFTHDGRHRILKLTRYDERKKAYVVTSRFYLDALPISVNVRTSSTDPVPSRYKPYAEYVLDPSGFVYEGVPSNRLEGVTATIYYRKDENSPEMLWDAYEYGQENPVLTDEYGMYAWDVPEGQWQVRFQKDGYEPTQTEWLPVPPPQLNINIPMKQSTPPVVKGAKAYSEDGVEIEFDKYMQTQTLIDNISVTCDGKLVEGSLVWLNPEGENENDENQKRYASRVKFLFPEGFTGTDIKVTVNTNVKSYAGLALLAPYTQDLQLTYPVKYIDAASVLAIQYKEKEDESSIKSLKVSARLSNNEHASSMILHANMLSTDIAEIIDGIDEKGDIQLDENGEATLTIQAYLPGSTALQFSVKDADVEAQTIVTVTEAESLKSEIPTASRANGAVYRGTLINLKSDDANAKIYYTISYDADEEFEAPTTESMLYTGPIAIDNKNVRIKAIAQVDGFDPSDVASFNYSISQNTANLVLAEGWSWISHNVEKSQDVAEFFEDVNIAEVKSLTQGTIRDEAGNPFGTLKELTPLEAYKVRSAAEVKKTITDDAFNASKSAISVAPGWNWIGYPMWQQMSVSQALAYYPASDGDVIVGLNDESAEYDGESRTWKGTMDLIPGQGYMLKTSKTNDLRYNTSIVSNAAARAHGRLDINNTPWSVDIHAYPNVMPMRLQIFRDEVLTDDEFTIAAFCGTECRGIGKYVDGVFFLNVHGEGTENITFVAMHNKKEYFVDMKESLTFTEDVVGSYRAPLALHLGSEQNNVKDMYSQFAVWPTVATTEVTVSLGGKTIDRLTVTSLDGKTTYAATPGVAQQKVNVTNLPAGIYILCAKSGNEYFYQKIMKVN